MSKRKIPYAVAALCFALAAPAYAGPPFLTDDPDPTPLGTYEIYGFAAREHARDGNGGAFGVDFNYGGGAHLQLTATLPINWEHADGEEVQHGLGNIELAAKYQFVHQEESGWNVAVFPRLFLPTDSDLGDHHAALLLPIWVGRNGETWSTFGGGGCALNRGGGSQDYCQLGWAYTHSIGEHLRVGGEVFHQTADVKGGAASTTLGVGATYDVSERLHVLGYLGQGVQHRDEAARTALYTSILLTF